MLSEKLRDYFKENKWSDDQEIEMYKGIIEKLGITSDSDFNLFYSYVEDGPTFLSDRGFELYHIGWFILYTGYERSIEYVQRNLSLPSCYLPLDSFEAEHGFFYNKETGEVIELELGDCLNNFHKGIVDKKWGTFNAFLEWYFGLE